VRRYQGGVVARPFGQLVPPSVTIVIVVVNVVHGFVNPMPYAATPLGAPTTPALVAAPEAMPLLPPIQTSDGAA
jgi:hypothetical protein